MYGPIPPLCRPKECRDLRSSRQDLEWKQPVPKPSDVRVEACPCFQLSLCQRAVRLHLRRRRSEEHTSELQSPCNLVCRLLLEKKKKKTNNVHILTKKTKY